MKTIFITVTSALLLQIISGQCLGYNAVPTISAGCGYGNGLGSTSLNTAALNYGSGLNVGSSSPFGPIGLTIVSENEISGNLAVEGQLPFLAAVVLDGQVPSSGSGGVSYSCGDSDVGIASQGQAGGLSYGAGVGYSAGLGGLSVGSISSGCACARR